MGYGIRSHLRGHRLYRYLRQRESYAAALDRRKPLLRYIGWLGHNNVGDEALFAAFRQPLFSGCLVTPYYDLSAQSTLAAFKARKAVVLGGGTLINDNNYLEPLERSQRRGDRSFVFGTGVGDLAYWAEHPHDHRGNSDRWLAALSRAEYVGVRGPRSLRWLHENGVTRAEILGDPALSLALNRPVVRPEEPTLGVNLGSHDPVSGGADPSWRSMAALVRHALDAGMHVRYISMHAIDLALGEALVAAVADPRFTLEPFDGHVAQTLEQIASCHFAVGQRLHFTVLACAVGVPNLSLSYQPKCMDFLESIHRADLALATEQVTPALIVERFEWLRKEAASLSVQIGAACGQLRRQQRRRANELTKALAD